MTARKRIFWVASGVFACVSVVTARQTESGGRNYLLQAQMFYQTDAINDSCDFQVQLWDSPISDTAPIGSPQLYRHIQVRKGRFSLLLSPNGELGPQAFTGEANWLQISLRCSNDKTFITFPRRLWLGDRSPGYDLNWWTADGGGGKSTAGGFEVTGTIGQSEGAGSTGGGYGDLGGFWAVASGYRIYFPLVYKP